MEFNLGYWPLITGGIVLIAIILCAVFKPYVMDLTDDEIDNKIEEYWSDCGKVIGTNLEEEYSSKPSKIPNAICIKLNDKALAEETDRLWDNPEERVWLDKKRPTIILLVGYKA